MIERYTRENMGRIWSTGNKYRQWLEVELAALLGRQDAVTVRTLS